VGTRARHEVLFTFPDTFLQLPRGWPLLTVRHPLSDSHNVSAAPRATTISLQSSRIQPPTHCAFSPLRTLEGVSLMRPPYFQQKNIAREYQTAWIWLISGIRLSHHVNEYPAPFLLPDFRWRPISPRANFANRYDQHPLLDTTLREIFLVITGEAIYQVFGS
jgi:hypothetical protein